MHPSKDRAIVPLFSENMPPKAVMVNTATKAKRKDNVDKRTIMLDPPFLVLL
jgi:hypothetical protein